jgi:hypothetical protein
MAPASAGSNWAEHPAAADTQQISRERYPFIQSAVSRRRRQKVAGRCWPEQSSRAEAQQPEGSIVSSTMRPNVLHRSACVYHPSLHMNASVVGGSAADRLVPVGDGSA